MCISQGSGSEPVSFYLQKVFKELGVAYDNHLNLKNPRTYFGQRKREASPEIFHKQIVFNNIESQCVILESICKDSKV